MKNPIKKYALSFLLLAAAASLGACDEWTEPESLDVKKPSLEQGSPELYAQYLEALKSYKQRPEHKVVYTWFDNSMKTPASRGQHITSVPDSVDVIALTHADNLAAWEVEDMATVRTKGTRVIYSIRYTDLTAAYDAYLEAFNAPVPEDADPEAPEVPVAQTLPEFAAEYMAAQVALCDKYDYDGISAAYTGLDTTHLSASELADYTAAQAAFFDPIAAWIAANPSKLLVLEGNISTILNAELVPAFRHVIVQTQSLSSTSAIDYEIRKSLSDTAPSDRFVLAVSTPSFDVLDTTTGYFGSKLALTQVAYWMSVPISGYSRVGIAIYDVQNDYYHMQQIYRHTRQAIAIMN